MSSIKTKLFLTTTLMILLLPFLTPVQAQACPIVTKYKASYSCLVSGECVVYPDFDMFGPPSQLPTPCIGRGTVSLCGSAEVTPYPAMPTLPYISYMATSGVKALGMFNARWDGQSISLLLYSCRDTAGVFVDEGTMPDTFGVGFAPIPETTLVPSLSYRGTYRTSTGIKTISGKAIVIAETVGPEMGGPMTVAIVTIYRADKTPLATLQWFLQDIPFPIPPYIVHAAHIVKQVKITQLR